VPPLRISSKSAIDVLLAMATDHSPSGSRPLRNCARQRQEPESARHRCLRRGRAAKNASRNRLWRRCGSTARKEIRRGCRQPSPPSEPARRCSRRVELDATRIWPVVAGDGRSRCCHHGPGRGDAARSHGADSGERVWIDCCSRDQRVHRRSEHMQVVAVAR